MCSKIIVCDKKPVLNVSLVLHHITCVNPPAPLYLPLLLSKVKIKYCTRLGNLFLLTQHVEIIHSECIIPRKLEQFICHGAIQKREDWLDGSSLMHSHLSHKQSRNDAAADTVRAGEEVSVS